MNTDDEQIDSPLGVHPRSSAVAPLPGAGFPGAGVVVRGATMGDVAFIDGLQKANSKALGFFPRAQMEGYVREGGVLVAEAPAPGRGSGFGVSGSGLRDAELGTRDAEPAAAQPLGYIVSRDRYLKRDELGVIYQLCVAPLPGVRRKLVGANLVKAAFERSAWGCRLYCCWCAQDLEANRFWEALGFVPIAFRTGGRVYKESRKGGKEGERGIADGMANARRETRNAERGAARSGGRVHIFWQKPIRAEDAEAARRGVFRGWWFPAKTDHGAMRADRLVLPIPPGVKWWEEMPVLVPDGPPEDGGGPEGDGGREAGGWWG